MTISELILMLKEIEKEHGDISVKRPYLMDEYGDWEYTDIDEAEYYKPKKESENSNENTDAYIVLW